MAVTASTNVQSSGRFGLDPAPGGMRLAQDLVNTAVPDGAPAPDLLQDVTLANAWIGEAIGAWATQTAQAIPALTLSERDLGRVRTFRAELQTWLADRTAPLASGPLTLSVALEDGKAKYGPNQDGAQGVIGLVAAELLLAAHTGALPRLKACANPGCRAAFYDGSRNTSRVWHDVKTCGNVANLRASRARRRDTQPS